MVQCTAKLGIIIHRIAYSFQQEIHAGGGDLDTSFAGCMQLCIQSQLHVSLWLCSCSPPNRLAKRPGMFLAELARPRRQCKHLLSQAQYSLFFCMVFIYSISFNIRLINLQCTALPLPFDAASVFWC